jgi:hypothetical protein
MMDLIDLAVDRQGRAHDIAAEGLADGLMAEADAEHRHGVSRGADQIETNACLARRAGAGRQHDGVGPVASTASTPI